MSKTNKMVFTINNYTPEDEARVLALDAVAVKAGREKGDEKNTPHIQGAVIWNFQVSYKTAQRRLCGKGVGCFTKKMGGSWADQDYCLKGGDIIRNDPYEEQQGKRNDIIKFRDSIKRGATDAELCDEHPSACAKFQRFIGFARAAYEEQPVALEQGSKRMGYWIWSDEPNMGKTSWVGKNFPDSYEKNSDRWWDDYAHEDVVFVDEPNPVWFASFWNYLKIWCQEKPFRAQRGVGAGKMTIRFKQIFVFANQSPEDYFTGKDDKKSVWDAAIFKSRFRVLQVKTPIFNEDAETIIQKCK